MQIQKLPDMIAGETPVLTVDFSDRLFSGGIISNPGVTAIDLATNLDATSAIFSGVADFNAADQVVPIIENGKIVGSRTVVAKKAVLRQIKDTAPAGNYKLLFSGDSSLNSEKLKEYRTVSIVP